MIWFGAYPREPLLLMIGKPLPFAAIGMLDMPLVTAIARFVPPPPSLISAI